MRNYRASNYYRAPRPGRHDPNIDWDADFDLFAQRHHVGWGDVLALAVALALLTIMGGLALWGAVTLLDALS